MSSSESDVPVVEGLEETKIMPTMGEDIELVLQTDLNESELAQVQAIDLLAQQDPAEKDEDELQYSMLSWMMDEEKSEEDEEEKEEEDVDEVDEADEADETEQLSPQKKTKIYYRRKGGKGNERRKRLEKFNQQRKRRKQKL